MPELLMLQKELSRQQGQPRKEEKPLEKSVWALEPTVKFLRREVRDGRREGSSWVSVFPLPRWDYFTHLGPCLESLGSQRLPSLSLQLRGEEMNAWRWEVPEPLVSSLAAAKCIPLPSFSSGPFVLPSNHVAAPLNLLFLLLKKPLHPHLATPVQG